MGQNSICWEGYNTHSHLKIVPVLTLSRDSNFKYSLKIGKNKLLLKFVHGNSQQHRGRESGNKPHVQLGIHTKVYLAICTNSTTQMAHKSMFVKCQSQNTYYSCECSEQENPQPGGMGAVCETEGQLTKAFLSGVEMSGNKQLRWACP